MDVNGLGIGAVKSLTIAIGIAVRQNGGLNSILTGVHVLVMCAARFASLAPWIELPVITMNTSVSISWKNEMPCWFFIL
jgi:hypothetical protein